MNELINVRNENGELLVSARELHKGLEVKSRFNDWINNRIKKYDLIEDIDYTKILVECNRGQNVYDFVLKIDCAKELSMVENNEKAGYNIFNTTTYQLTINNPRSLTMYEKYAILAMFAANVNFNSFAAEVEFHADALYDWKSGIKDWVLIGIFPSADKWYNAAIRADMAIGEDSESGFYDQYYDLESDLVKNQAEVHGEF